MMEVLARLLAKHPEAQVPDRHLWKLYESCHALRLEGGCRVAVSHLLREYGEEEDTAALVSGIARICRQVDWSKTLQELVNAWWRDYAQSLALAQLQRLERELDEQRNLEPQKQILKTTLAMRRWLHSRDAVDFAEAINTAFTIVEQFTDAFDAAPTEIDSRTIRSEVDALSQALTSEQRHILATNLRNLAQRITHMAENRSKPSLIRSDDSIDRQLMHGEAHPHGAIDMMKWVAGYLDGAHQPEGIIDLTGASLLQSRVGRQSHADTGFQGQEPHLCPPSHRSLSTAATGRVALDARLITKWRHSLDRPEPHHSRRQS